MITIRNEPAKFSAAIGTGLINADDIQKLSDRTDGCIRSRLKSISDNRTAGIDHARLLRRIAELWKEVAFLCSDDIVRHEPKMRFSDEQRRLWEAFLFEGEKDAT